MVEYLLNLDILPFEIEEVEVKDEDEGYTTIKYQNYGLLVPKSTNIIKDYVKHNRHELCITLKEAEIKRQKLLKDTYEYNKQQLKQLEENITYLEELMEDSKTRMETNLTDKEKDSLLKFFLTHGELVQQDNGDFEWQFFSDITFLSFQKDFVDLLIKALDNLRFNLNK